MVLGSMVEYLVGVVSTADTPPNLRSKILVMVFDVASDVIWVGWRDEDQDFSF